VIVASHRNPMVTQWDPVAFDALEEIGASSQIRFLQDNSRFIIMGRKGTNAPAEEVFAPNNGPSTLQVLATLTTNFERGGLKSTRIGPALKWESLIWDWRSKDAIVQENINVAVYGVRRDGSDSLLKVDLLRGSYSLADIDAQEFPYLQLEGDFVDSIRRTAPQLDNWHVIYDPAPDAIIDLETDFAFQSDTLFEGQDIYLKMGAKNISQVDMDSVNVSIHLIREDRSLLPIDTLRIAPLQAGGPSIPFEATFSSTDKNLSGNVQLVVEVNPEQNPLEQYAFNNLYIRPFEVVVDQQSPILDVTFDGKHILDGDIVSPQPEIVIEVNDENAYVPLDDSSTFTLIFSKGTNNILDTGDIAWAVDPRVEWEPGQLPDNKARLRFYPGKFQPLEDGEYLLKVQGQDSKGNAAGGGPDFYEISFRVENQSTLTQVVNYPNPFSTSTRFVYTLTGSELPEVFQIHIYTISGKLVKVVDLKALGDLHFGNNITDYAWDGTDEFGDPLANGVYVYRLVTRMAEDIAAPEQRNVGIDQYFNNGWGKMVIIR